MKPLCVLAAPLFLCLPSRLTATPGGGYSSRHSRHSLNPPFSSHFSTVVIDAGHGGVDRGGIPGQRISEKIMTLDTALRVRTGLRALGFHVVMTRSDDTFVSLPARVAIADAQSNAIFVSIHYNATPRAGARGIETYYSAPSAAPLAKSLQSRLTHWTRTDDRGVKQRGFYVLRNPRIPAVLVEPGFLTNPDEGRLILDPKSRQRIADLIVKGIVDKHSGPITSGT